MARPQVLLITLVCLSLHSPAQSTVSPAAGAASCQSAPDFTVKTAIADQAVQPQPGKALVYFIETIQNSGPGNPKPTLAAGVDGTWPGATRGNSYFYFFVDPGVHHLCASMPPVFFASSADSMAAAHFTAEAGRVYYFQAVWIGGTTTMSVTLKPLDSDEGELLTSSYKLATSQVKKVKRR